MDGTLDVQSGELSYSNFLLFSFVILDNLHNLSGPQLPHVERAESERSESSHMSSFQAALCQDSAFENDLPRNRGATGSLSVSPAGMWKEGFTAEIWVVMNSPLSFQVAGRFMVGLIVLWIELNKAFLPPGL